MKLIIDIPEELKNKIDSATEKNYRTYIWWFETTLYCAIKNGMPLDDVKAEIEKEENILYHDCDPENGWKKFDVIRVDRVFDILDNIGKAESEGIK